MRIYLGALVHETNSFSPLPTTLRSFAEEGLHHRPGDELTFERARQTPGYGDAFRAMVEADDEVVAGSCAWAMPSGVVSREAYETLRDEMLAEVERAGAIDAVFLFLHGAMVADGYPDCEGDLLFRVRRIVGNKMPVGVLLDLHGNLSDAMVQSGAIMVACKEYPHTDYPLRVRELRSILEGVVRGGVMPETYMKQVPMVAPLGTTENPMHDFVRRLEACEGNGGILSVSAMHGFAWSDTPDMGAAILVVHEGRNSAVAARAESLAETLAAGLFAIRASGMSNRLSVANAIDRAFASASGLGPVVLADSSDNPGGGAACDSTFVLQALLDRKAADVALGMIWDPQAALIAADAGVGARIPLRIGGKVGPQSGDPVDVLVEVLAVLRDAQQADIGSTGGDPLGLTVAVRAVGIDIVLNSIRQQTFSPDCFTQLGIDVQHKRLVVVKSSQHFREGFDPIATSTIYCNAPGSLNLDLAALPYTRIRHPIWPLDPIESPDVGRGAKR